jgi:predicted TIM-barrel fold metal-dependent hydrolase
VSGDGSARFDCDVHCGIPSNRALWPYLDAHWREFLTIGAVREPPALGVTYPRWVPMFAARAEEVTVETLQGKVLQGSAGAIVNCYYGVESYTHPYLADAMATAVNEWLRDEFLARDERLLGSAVVTPQYPEFAVEQIRKIAEDRRFVQIVVPARAPVGYGNQRYWPIWEAAAEHDLVVAITGGGSTGTPPTPIGWLAGFIEEYEAGILNFQGQIMSLAMSGIFERCPNLRFVVLESGWTWLPAWFWRMDQEWRAFQREVPWMHGAPSTYVRRHMRFTTAPTDAPADGPQLREVIGHLESDELLLYSSDFPHRYDDAPDLAKHLSPEQLERVLHTNAADWYRLNERVLAPAGS